MTTVDMVAGPVSKGMVSGTTATEVRADDASSISPCVAFASAGCALSMERADVSSSMSENGACSSKGLEGHRVPGAQYSWFNTKSLQREPSWRRLILLTSQTSAEPADVGRHPSRHLPNTSSPSADVGGRHWFSEKEEYSFILSENNLYYYTQKDSNIAIPAGEIYQHNFRITINKQELKHKCTRLVEAERHLEKNPHNVSFKGVTYARFPSNMNEFQLFFCTKVPHENLKKNAEKIISDFYRFKMVSDTAYFSKYARIMSGYTDKCEIRALDFLTEGLYFYLSKNPEGFFEVINNYDNEQITCILKSLVRNQSKEQQEHIFGKLPSYNNRIYSLYTKINTEKKAKW